eukprot:CCRYP_021086-RD/>CCRYP_021086-RD protein AED:0.49 eAED:1.00 QI:0/0/0/1/0/0/2/0/74
MYYIKLDIIPSKLDTRHLTEYCLILRFPKRPSTNRSIIRDLSNQKAPNKPARRRATIVHMPTKSQKQDTSLCEW